MTDDEDISCAFCAWSAPNYDLQRTHVWRSWYGEPICNQCLADRRTIPVPTTPTHAVEYVSLQQQIYPQVLPLSQPIIPLSAITPDHFIPPPLHPQYSIPFDTPTVRIGSPYGPQILARDIFEAAFDDDVWGIFHNLPTALPPTSISRLDTPPCQPSHLSRGKSLDTPLYSSRKSSPPPSYPSPPPSVELACNPLPPASPTFNATRLVDLFEVEATPPPQPMAPPFEPPVLELDQEEAHKMDDEKVPIS